MAVTETTVYGRSDGADVVLANDTVSGRHCELSVTDGVYSLRDLGSTNGTFVNGERMTTTIPVTTAPKPVETTVDISTTVKPLPPPTTVNLYDKPASADEMDELVKQAEDAVVLVICEDRTGTMRSTGSGWPLQTDIGVVIVTNEHVVAECVPQGGWRLIVDWGTGPEDEKWEEAEIYSWDSENDLAIIKIQAPIEPLATAGPPKKLHWVMAVGNPMSGVDSMTEGYVSNYENYRIVHSAAINPGNSGGPLINAEGKVVGVNTLKGVGEDVDNVGIAFALHRLCEQLIPTCPDHWQE
jgi:S1-C subfamily serine protease